MLDPDTDFAIRRRIPRILGAVASERALSGLVRGLDDARFEVELWIPLFTAWHSRLSRAVEESARPREQNA